MYGSPITASCKYFWADLLRAVRMSVAAVASKPEVGSSMKRRLGFATSSIPMLTLFRCPPLIPRLSTEPTRECCKGNLLLTTAAELHSNEYY